MTWATAMRIEVAEPPEYAAIAAQWLQPARTKGGASVQANMRPLSTAEARELECRARAIRLRIIPLIAVMMLGDAVMAVLWAMGNWNGAHPVAFLASALCVLATMTALTRTIADSRKLQRDRARGCVLIIHYDRPRDDDDDGAIREILPASYREWTHGGRPAQWRTA